MKYFSTKILSSHTLLNNYQTLKNISKKNICAVLKANAYGHGAKSVCKILSSCCDFFAVENIVEALQVRKVNKTAKILVLGYCKNYHQAQKYNISVTIDNLQELEKISKEKLHLSIHLKINTGMNRLGLKNINDLKEILQFLSTQKSIKLEGIYTHCFCTENKKTTKKQLKILKKCKKITKNYNFSPFFHIGGSGMINYNLHFVDYIRCGISLYGYMCKCTYPVLKIVSKIVKISTIQKDEYVGYDCYYKTSKKTKIAVVPLGYADGIPRQIQDNLSVKFDNQNLKVIGKICMDMMMIDVSNTKAKIGDYVTVFNDAKIWSNMSNLSEYEILTGLNSARTDIKVD